MGVVSGVLGIAAAATLLTPAGPPLLISSILFGGSATAVQTSFEVRNHFSQTTKLADRVIALHAISKSILRVTTLLHDALLSRQGPYNPRDAIKRGVLVAKSSTQGLTLGGVSVVAAEAGATARGAQFATRAGTAAARTARFARFAGGALSAAVLVMEANTIHNALEQIRKGNPCDKARMLIYVREELDQFPTTECFEEEISSYLRHLDDCRLEEHFEEHLCSTQLAASPPCARGVVILDGEEENDTQVLQRDSPKTLDPTTLSSSKVGTLSLLERIQKKKTQTSSNNSEQKNHAASPDPNVALMK